MSASSHCLVFWYLMFGPHVGSLNAYVQTTDAIHKDPIWSRSGDKGPAWQKATITFSATEHFRIVIESVRIHGYLGDIAMDDVKLESSSCSSESAVYSCDFEQSNNCQFKPDTSYNSVWTRSEGDADHTFQTPFGHYMFANTSSNARARLDSFIINSDQEQCLTFWYNMMHDAKATLNVYLKQQNKYRLLWSMTGSPVGEWIFASIHLSALPGPSTIYTITFEATLGSIAIDDFQVDYGSCGCDFEEGFCSWTNDQHDVFDWTLLTGPTTISNTGPANDHTYGNKTGRYAYIETYAPRNEGDSAVLVSHMHAPTARSCFHFWFHMNGSGMGSLHVGVRGQDGNVTYIWFLYGSQSDSWQRGQVELSPQNERFRILFLAVRGPTWTSNIAIDDISTDEAYPCVKLPSIAGPNGTNETSTTTTELVTTFSTHPSSTPSSHSSAQTTLKLTECPREYCRNGGECSTSSENLATCRCFQNWTGPRCESKAQPITQNDGDTNDWAIPVIIVLAGATLLALVGVAIMCRRVNVQRQSLDTPPPMEGVSNPEYVYSVIPARVTLQSENVETTNL